MNVKQTVMRTWKSGLACFVHQWATHGEVVFLILVWRVYLLCYEIIEVVNTSCCFAFVFAAIEIAL
jgi:hypothetical protein